MTIKEDIFRLKSEGKSYREISSSLPCSKATVAYYLSEGQKDKTLLRSQNLRKKYRILEKISNYKGQGPARKNSIILEVDISSSYRKRMRNKVGTFQRTNNPPTLKFGLDEVLDKIGQNPICYLSGRDINLNSPRSFHFDHIIPVSKGGENSLENLGMTDREANIAKNNLSVPELLELCSDILKYNGYHVEKL